jgi:hypothetical protein
LGDAFAPCHDAMAVGADVSLSGCRTSALAAVAEPDQGPKSGISRMPARLKGDGST